MIIDFIPLWAVILALGVFLYVLLDGFDLGVGMIYGLVKEREHRNLIMNSIAPVWDGNETWLVLGGVALLAAFPLAFAIIIPAVYFPILIMLLALIFRGVSFEYHYRDVEHTTFWDRAFFVGSLVATFAQGVILGAFIQGFQVNGRHFVGHILDCFTPFSVFTGLALICGYGLLGAGWLIFKTEGELQERVRKIGLWFFAGVILSMIVVSIWTPLMNSTIRERWFTWPNIGYLSIIPIITALVAYQVWLSLTNAKYELTTFVGAVGLFLLSYIGIGISMYPMIVPHHYTIWQAASAPKTQAFLIIGTVFLLPIILMYSAWSYWVFRGKVRHDIGYH